MPAPAAPPLGALAVDGAKNIRAPGRRGAASHVVPNPDELRHVARA